MSHQTLVYADKALATYHFGEQHPFGPQRYQAFADKFYQLKLDQWVDIGTAKASQRKDIELFHTSTYVEKVIQASKTGTGYLDGGDTPAVKGIYEASNLVVGTILDAVAQIMSHRYKRAFIPIAGLHHASRISGSGFCVFNDCGIAIEVLRQQYGIQRVAYVDIDAHHGNGVFYAFETDPDLIFADLHEDGRYLYPGTGFSKETGTGKAKGTKLNIPMLPESNDDHFYIAWKKVEAYLHQHQPEFIILQCGADSIKGDPITHLCYSATAHYHAAKSLCNIAEQYAEGRLIATGGGGYDATNIANGWNAVVQAFITYENQ